MKKGKINISNIRGDVVVSSGQTGGITATKTGGPLERKRMSPVKKIGAAIGTVSAIVGILAYLNITPNHSNDTKSISKDTLPQPASTVQPLDAKSPMKSKQTVMKKEPKEDTSLEISHISGDVVVSQNQSGGITAHTVYINRPEPRQLS
ncbi:MAG: hypothetical protein EOO20_25750, partial [Chryseobacterium sp.]